MTLRGTCRATSYFAHPYVPDRRGGTWSLEVHHRLTNPFATKAGTRALCRLYMSWEMPPWLVDAQLRWYGEVYGKELAPRFEFCSVRISEAIHGDSANPLSSRSPCVVKVAFQSTFAENASMNKTRVL